MEIKRVLIRSDGVKYIIIPKKSNLQVGDYVRLIKLTEEDYGRRKDEEGRETIAVPIS